MAEKQLKTNQSLEKSFQIIEVMAQGKGPMRLQDIAQQSALPAATALRMINTMLTLGYINQDPVSLRYALSLKFARIGSCVSAQVPIREIARPYMLELSNRFNESACLALEQGGEIVYIDVVDGPDNMLKITQYIGKRAPMHCTGVGKLFLLNNSEEQLEHYAACKGLPGMTPCTITTLEGLQEELGHIRACGYALDNEECELGARCIAAGIRDYTGKVVCGLSLSGPISRMTMERIAEIAPILMETAGKVSSQMGFSS